MRSAHACVVLASVSLAAMGVAFAQTSRPGQPAPALAAAPPPAATPSSACAGNPNALGVARIVEIDTTGGPGFGFEHFKMHDFLRADEVVLTFDDGPWLNNTPGGAQGARDSLHQGDVLPDRQARDLLSGNPPAGRRRRAIRSARTPGAMRTSTRSRSKRRRPRSRWASARCGSRCNADASPFFRFPQLKHPPEVVTYLGQRNIAHLLDRLRLVRFHHAQAGAGDQIGHDQAAEARQGHRAHARLPAAHRRGRCRSC